MKEKQERIGDATGPYAAYAMPPPAGPSGGDDGQPSKKKARVYASQQGDRLGTQTGNL